MGRYLPDGKVEFLGHLNHQVKIRGFRIEMDEIEVVLTQHPKIQQALVLVQEDQSDQKMLAAIQERESQVGPKNAIEKQLIQIWEDVLAIHPIGLHQNFFTLGGHSLPRVA